MKLTSSVLEKLKAPDAKAIRTKLALELNFTESWTLRCIKENKLNGPLTTVKAVQIIMEDTGLSQENILEEGEKHWVRQPHSPAA